NKRNAIQVEWIYPGQASLDIPDQAMRGETRFVPDFHPQIEGSGNAERLSSRGRTQLRCTQVVDEKPAGPARVQRFVMRRHHGLLPAPSPHLFRVGSNKLFSKFRVIHDLVFQFVIMVGIIPPSWIMDDAEN